MKKKVLIRSTETEREPDRPDKADPITTPEMTDRMSATMVRTNGISNR
jgi:hypothetical protein